MYFNIFWFINQCMYLFFNITRIMVCGNILRCTIWTIALSLYTFIFFKSIYFCILYTIQHMNIVAWDITFNIFALPLFSTFMQSVVFLLFYFDFIFLSTVLFFSNYLNHNHLSQTLLLTWYIALYLFQFQAMFISIFRFDTSFIGRPFLNTFF